MDLLPLTKMGVNFHSVFNAARFYPWSAWSLPFSSAI